MLKKNYSVILIISAAVLFCSARNNLADKKMVPDNYLPDSDSLNFSFTVYNLDNTDEQSLHRNDSICKLFGCDQYQSKNQLYKYIKGDSTHFLFIRTLTTCCPNPIGKIESSMDTLKLIHTLPPEGPFCDAFCPYMFIYSIPTREINRRIVSIK